jgi:NitT/TauT family transport system permease protein
MPYFTAVFPCQSSHFPRFLSPDLVFDFSSEVAFAALIATFPIVVATAAGLRAASENERMLLKSIGASRM